ncbi:MAG: hypothetical protein M3Q61_06970 [Chloroflexota bacterium]|nr:hypothetical protein [Chloroflexota bacterium]
MRRSLAVLALAAVAALIVALSLGVWRSERPGAVTLSPSPTTATIAASPPVTASVTASPTTPATAASGATGTITGKLGYPSDFIPELTVYAIRQGDPSRYFSVNTPLVAQAPAGSVSYTIAGVEPGTYVVIAYARSSPAGTTKGGAWTAYARCGLTASCPLDHTLIPVVVTGGGTAGGADVTDWYLRQDEHYPPKPS